MNYEEAAEYHRGYVDGRRARAAQEWQLENERQIVVNRLQSLDLNDGSHENLSKICRAIYNASQGWTKEACEELAARLSWLLGSETGSKVDYVASVKELLDIVVLNTKDVEEELIKKLYILSLTSMASFDHARYENDKLRKYVQSIANLIYKGGVIDCGKCRFFNQCYQTNHQKEHEGRGCQWLLWAREIGIEVKA